MPAAEASDCLIKLRLSDFMLCIFKLKESVYQTYEKLIKGITLKGRQMVISYLQETSSSKYLTLVLINDLIRIINPELFLSIRGLRLEI
jgi:hypothetical protein